MSALATTDTPQGRSEEVKQEPPLTKTVTRQQMASAALPCVSNTSVNRLTVARLFSRQTIHLPPLPASQIFDGSDQTKKILNNCQFTFPLYSLFPMGKIWRELLFWKHCCYPHLNLIRGFNSTVKLQLKYQTTCYPTDLPYAQIPGYHMLVGYSYTDMIMDWHKFYTNKKKCIDRPRMDEWLYCKFKYIVTVLEWQDFYKIFTKQQDSKMELHSIIGSSDLSTPNLYTRIAYPDVNPKDLQTMDVCVYVGLWQWRDGFVDEASWKCRKIAKSYSWNDKMPRFVRPLSRVEINNLLPFNDSNWHT